MNNYIDGQEQLCQMPLHSSPQSAPDAVPLYCSTQYFANCKTDSRSCIITSLPVKNCYIPGKMFLPFLVHRLKVCVPE